MKLTIPKSSVILLAISFQLAWAASPDAIQRLELNPMMIIRVPVALDRLSTVRFPSPVSAIESALISTEIRPEALFLLSYQTGESSFSLRALAKTKSTTLNVTWKGQTYVFEPFQSEQPWLSVILELPSEPKLAQGKGSVTPSRLLGLLDTAKAYGFIRKQHPEAVAGVEVTRPNSTHDYGDYLITIEEVFRFDNADTLVFRIAVTNKTSIPIQFVPQSLTVRVGSRLYYQSIAEATGLVPPNSAIPIYFAITGTSDGSISALSPKNDFMVLFNRLDFSPTPTAEIDAVIPTKTAPVQQPLISSTDSGAVSSAAASHSTPLPTSALRPTYWPETAHRPIAFRPAALAPTNVPAHTNAPPPSHIFRGRPLPTRSAVPGPLVAPPTTAIQSTSALLHDHSSPVTMAPKPVRRSTIPTGASVPGFMSPAPKPPPPDEDLSLLPSTPALGRGFTGIWVSSTLAAHD